MIKYFNEVKTKEGWTLSVDMIRLSIRFKKEDDINKLIDLLNVDIMFKNAKMHEELNAAYLGGMEEIHDRKIDEAREERKKNGGLAFGVKADALGGQYDGAYQKPAMLVDMSHRSYVKYGEYKTLITIHPKHNPTSTIVIGAGMCGRGNELSGMIEFNPNKTYGEEVRWLLKWLTAHCTKMILKRYDIALDIPTSPVNIRLKKDIRKYRLDCPSAQNPAHNTEYLGQRNNPGFFKKYNKIVEHNSKLEEGEEPLTGELTRLELTSNTLDYNKFMKMFPYIDIKNVPQDGEQLNLLTLLEQEKKLEQLSQNDKVLVELLQASSDRDLMFSRLTKVKRKKLESYVYDDNWEQVIIQKKDFDKLMSDLVKTYCLFNTTIPVLVADKDA